MPGHDDGIRYQQFFDNGIAICGWKGPGSSRFPALCFYPIILFAARAETIASLMRDSPASIQL